MIRFIFDPEKELSIFAWVYKDKLETKPAALMQEELEQVILPSKFANLVENKVTRDWLAVQDNFLEKLGKFYGSELPVPNLTAYLVRLNRFPYDYKEGMWFAAPLFDSPAVRNQVIMHELCHYFQPVELPRPVKEAIPVILNDHEAFQMFSYDRGHNEPEEQRWRERILALYKRGKTFKDLLKEVEKEIGVNK